MSSSISIKSFAVKFAAILFAILISSTFILSSEAHAVSQAEVDAAKAQLDAADAEARKAAEAYYEAQDKHDAAVKKMEETKAKIAECETEIAKKQERLANRAVSMYRDGSISMLDVLFGSNSFKEFVTVWDMLTVMNENDSQLIEDIKNLKLELEQAYKEYEEAEKEAAKQVEEAKKAKKELEAKAAAYKSTYDGLSAELQAQVAAAMATDDSSTHGGGNGGNGGNGGGGGSSASGAKNGGGYGPCSVETAKAQVGKKYVYGTSGPNTFDCSGLASYCGAPYRSSSELYANAKSRVPVSEARPGDVLWMSGHVGVYIGGGQCVEAMDTAHGVVYNGVGKYTYALRF